MLAPVKKDRLAKYLLIGTQNAGKSSLFNSLTGHKRKVSNYSGVTTDFASGVCQLSLNTNAQDIELVDLPGITNLNPLSSDEAITVSTLFELLPEQTYDGICFVFDFHRLENSIALILAIKDYINKPVIGIINKDDQAQFDQSLCQQLEKKLEVPLIVTSSKHKFAQFKESFAKIVNDVQIIKDSIKKMPHHFIFDQSLSLLPGLSDVHGHARLEAKGAEEVSKIISHYHIKARTLVKDLPIDNNHKLTEQVDRYVLNPFVGGLIFLSVFYFIFSAIFYWAAPFMDFTEGLLINSGDWVGSFLNEGLLKSLIVDGIFAGVGGVVIFIPQIMILFFLMSLLEQSGYISRAAVIADKVMAIFGLSGKAFLPFLSGFACSIPGIMAARTISDSKERLATIVTLPLVTCSARLPVYVLLVGTFIPQREVFGIFGLQGLVFFFLYFLGPVMALIMAKIFRLSLFKGDNNDFFIDLPPYQMPALKVALKTSWNKGLMFLKKAGTIILALSIILWLLSTFPQTNFDQAQYQDFTQQQKNAIALENSALGHIGKAIEPVIAPIGMDWKIGVGLVVSLAARELFVSALGTIYALGDVDEQSDSLRDRLKKEKDPQTGAPIFSLATALSILMFFVFSLQCTSTLAILKKETGSWKVPLATFSYLLVMAYAASFMAYRLFI